MQQIVRVATESTGAEIRRLQFNALEQIRLLIETLSEDLLDRTKLGRAERERPGAGRFEPAPAVLVAQANEALRSA